MAQHKVCLLMLDQLCGHDDRPDRESLNLPSGGRAALFLLPSMLFPLCTIVMWALHDKAFAIPHFQRIDNSAAHSSAIKRKTDLNNCLNTCALNSSCNGVGYTDAEKTYVVNVATSDYYIRVNIAGSTAQCSAAQAPKAQCPAGWSLQPTNAKYGEQACFGSWNAAKTWCTDRDAHLATIDSRSRSTDVSMAVIGLRNVADAPWNFSIGFIANTSPNTQKGIFQQNSFHWIDGTKWNFSNFGDFQPSQQIGANCGMVNVLAGGIGFKWFNRACGTQVLFIVLQY